MTPKQIDKLLKLAERYVAVQEAKQKAEGEQQERLAKMLGGFEELMKKSLGISHLKSVK
jgi:hypothetical protein